MRNVLITGGSRGIGRETVKLVSERGDRVIFVYKSDDTSALECASQTGAISIKADVSAPEQVRQVCEKVLSEFSEIHVLILLLHAN